jgi:DNA-binding NtrC family response regulator
LLNLLLIDDDPALLPEQVRQTFPEPAHRVRVATSGADGVEPVQRHPPDVILLDLRLPDGSGLDVFERIRRIDARIPVIFVTLAKTSDTAIEAMKRGAFDYLNKPLDLERLRRVVSRPSSSGPEGGVQRVDQLRRRMSLVRFRCSLDVRDAGSGCGGRRGWRFG